MIGIHDVYAIQILLNCRYAVVLFNAVALTHPYASHVEGLMSFSDVGEETLQLCQRNVDQNQILAKEVDGEVLVKWLDWRKDLHVDGKYRCILNKLYWHYLMAMQLQVWF